MGRTFCEHKMEIFDAIIVVASFAIDLVFLGGVTGDEGQKAAGVIVVLLLWRIARVVDGIVITVKQRQEFRIILLKRARRVAERKLEMYDEERLARNKQIDALKELCMKAGVAEEEIHACTPRNTRRVSSTISALSSIARLSIGMTMSVPSQLCVSADGDVPATPAGTPVTPSAQNGAGWSTIDDEYPTTGDRSRGTCGACGRYQRHSFTRYSDSSVTSLPVAMAASTNRFQKTTSEAAKLEQQKQSPRRTQRAGSSRNRNPFSLCLSDAEFDEAGSSAIADGVEPLQERPRAQSDGARDRFIGAHHTAAARRNCAAAAAAAMATTRARESVNSPVNSTGVQIVIDAGVDDDETVFVVVVDGDNNDTIETVAPRCGLPLQVESCADSL